MKRFILLSFGIFVLASSAAAQRDKTPAFGSYPAKVEQKTAKAIDFKNSPGASTFRTRLRHALDEGVNFAGRFILTGWGCGTGCSHGAIIDARTGRVYFPDELMGVAGYDGPDGEAFTFRKNSRLLILRGTPGPDIEDAPERKEGICYYEWRANRFRLIKFIPNESSPNV